ncbi:MAG: hypothetical protein V7K95_34190 [Nostoc sp.]
MFQTKQDLHGSCNKSGIAAQRTAGLNATRVGHTRSNAWGEPHLWAK